MIVPARRRAPRAANYRRGMGVWNPPSRADFGLDPAGGGMNCDALDTACVARQNVASNAYVQAVQDAQVQNNYDVCAANAQNASTQAQYDDTMVRCEAQAAIQNAPMAGDVQGQAARTVPGVNPVTTPIAPVPWAGLPTVPVWSGANPPITVAPSQVNAGTVLATTPAGKTVVTSSGASTAPGATAAPLTVAGFNLSSIPWWGWAAAAGAAFFMFGGGRGR